jgi:acyl-CoA hydrolase
MKGTDCKVMRYPDAQRNPQKEETVKVTEATLTYVAVDNQRRPRVVTPQQ